MTSHRFDVRSDRGSYSVVVGRGAIDDLTSWIAAHGSAAGSRQVLVVSCPPVWRAQGARLRRAIGRTPHVLIGDGERAKTLATASRIYDALVKHRFDRAATVIAFGGGVVGDVAGFAAATFLRGINVVQVPTTLLAQVDSAIGGKVAVNLAAGKNLVGAFHPPSLVVCDPTMLSTLPRRQFRAGLYEVVKYGVIRSRPLFNRTVASLPAILEQDAATLTSLIEECCRIKADVVGQDEREHGLRRILNFGHTVGHALEAVTRYRRFLHGEAIAYGMLAAAHISRARDLLSTDDEAQLKALIVRLGKLPAVRDLRAARVLGAIQHDKKIVGGQLHYVLARGIGDTTTATDVSSRELTAALRGIGLA